MKLNETGIGIVLSFSLVTLCVLGAVDPMLSSIGAILGGGILCALCIRHGFIWGGGVSVLSGIAAFFFSGMIAPALVSLSIIVGIGFVLAGCIHRAKSFHFTVTATIISVVAMNAVITLIGTYIQYGIITTQTILAPILDMADSLYTPLFSGEGSQEALQELKTIMANSYIGYTIVSGIVMAYFAFLFGRSILKMVYKQNMQAYEVFDSFKISQAGGIFFAGCFVAMLLVTSPVLKLACSNFIIIMSPIFLFGGLSLLKYFLTQFGVGRRGRTFVYIGVFLTGALPYFSLVNGTIALGVADALFNYRKLGQDT